MLRRYIGALIAAVLLAGLGAVPASAGTTNGQYQRTESVIDQWSPDRGSRFLRIGAALLAAALLMSACSISSDSIGAGVAFPSAGKAGEGGQNPATWETEVTIVPPEFTDQEREDFRASWVADMARAMGLQDVPVVPLVRWTEGHLDNAKALAQCYTEAGFPAEVGSDGFAYVLDGVPSSRTDAFLVVAYTCEAR